MRPRRTWRLLVGTGLAAASSIGSAQSDNAIAQCSRIADADERILCLEYAIRTLSDEETPSPVEASPEPAPEAAAAPPTTEPPAPVEMPEIDDEVIVATEPAAEVPEPSE